MEETQETDSSEENPTPTASPAEPSDGQDEGHSDNPSEHSLGWLSGAMVTTGLWIVAFAIIAVLATVIITPGTSQVGEYIIFGVIFTFIAALTRPIARWAKRSPFRAGFIAGSSWTLSLPTAGAALLVIAIANSSPGCSEAAEGDTEPTFVKGLRQGWRAAEGNSTEAEQESARAVSSDTEGSSSTNTAPLPAGKAGAGTDSFSHRRFVDCIEKLYDVSDGDPVIEDGIRRLSRKGTSYAVAEDLVQTAIITICEYDASGSDRIDQPKPYLNAVLLNLSVQKYKRSTDPLDRTDCKIVEYRPRPGGTRQFDKAAQMRREFLTIKQAICKLDLKDQHVLALAAEGHTGPEMGEMLDISEVAARKRLQRARERLNAAL